MKRLTEAERGMCVMALNEHALTCDQAAEKCKDVPRLVESFQEAARMAKALAIFFEGADSIGLEGVNG